MNRLLVCLAVLMLIALVGYARFSAKPLDARSSIESGIEQAKKSSSIGSEEEALLRVQLAISDFMVASGNPPATLAELVPKYFDEEPKNPTTGQVFEYRVEGRQPKLGGQIGKVAKAEKGEGQNAPEDNKNQKDNFINPNTMELDDFTYDKTGKRDPFTPFDFSDQGTVIDPQSPLTSYSLGQLRLTAVVVAPDGSYKGIVEDNTGRGYTANVGTKIGKDKGEVVAIEKDMLKIVETHIDFTGAETSKVVEMKINFSGPAGQVKSNSKKAKK